MRYAIASTIVALLTIGNALAAGDIIVFFTIDGVNAVTNTRNFNRISAHCLRLAVDDPIGPDLIISPDSEEGKFMGTIPFDKLPEFSAALEKWKRWAEKAEKEKIFGDKLVASFSHTVDKSINPNGKVGVDVVFLYQEGSMPQMLLDVCSPRKDYLSGFALLHGFHVDGLIECIQRTPDALKKMSAGKKKLDQLE